MTGIYISMLRGINVGSQNKIRMEDLKKLYADLGFLDTLTYIQSGNVVFRTEKNRDAAREIETAIKKKFGYVVPVIIRTKKSMQRIIEGNPFLQEKNILHDKLHVTFLSGQPAQIPSSLPLSDGADRMVVAGMEVYLYCPGGYGKTRYNNTFLEKKLGISGTTRNWRTVQALQALAESLSGEG